MSQAKDMTIFALPLILLRAEGLSLVRQLLFPCLLVTPVAGAGAGAAAGTSASPAGRADDGGRGAPPGNQIDDEGPWRSGGRAISRWQGCARETSGWWLELAHGEGSDGAALSSDANIHHLRFLGMP